MISCFDRGDIVKSIKGNRPSDRRISKARLFGQHREFIPMMEGIARHKWLTIGILIALLLSIFSIMMIMVFGFGASTPETPTGIISHITATPDGNISISFGVVTPLIRYQDCQVILVPPGNSGADSSAQAKLWNVGESLIFDYNSSIHMGLHPPQPHGYVGTSGIANNSLIISCSSSGKIPEGKWAVYLVYHATTGAVASATWHVNETPATDQSLSFTFAEHKSDAMTEYGFYHSPGFWESGYFWLGVFYISLIASFALIIALAAVLAKEKRLKGKR
jgi:hypothetical protein